MDGMKHIGIVGGLSPESTIDYYKTICSEYNKRVGGVRFPQITIRSLDLQEIADTMNSGDWNGVAQKIASAVDDLRRGGADFAAIATNTPHNAIDRIRELASLEILSITDATAQAIKNDGLLTVGLLGTKPTMEYGFFQKTFREHGIETIIPYDAQRIDVNRIIWDELVKGNIRDVSRDIYTATIQQLVERGAQGIILGCTEIPLLIRPKDSPVKTYNTADIHARAILEYAMRHD